MSNISGQLIKDSYNYVLQSDLATGVVYRIGGAIPVNPIFSSGMTILGSFKYQDGSETDGFVLTCDASGNAVWKPVSGATAGTVVTGGSFDYSAHTLTLNNSNGTNVVITGLTDTFITGGTISGTSVIFNFNNGGNFVLTGITPLSLFQSYTAATEIALSQKLDLSGGTINGNVNILGNLTANTISAATYLNLPAFTGNYLPLSGGTVSGNTIFQNGLTATTISASTYQNLPIDPNTFITAFTYNNNTFTIKDNAGQTFNASINSLTGLTVNGNLSATTISANTLYVNGVQITGDTYVTGGTYSNGVATFTNNQGNSFQVSGFVTGFTDVYTTGATYDNNTKLATFTRNDGSGYTLNLSSITFFDTFVTGGTYNPSTGVATFTNNSGNTFNVSGFFKPSDDTYVTGGTYTNGNIIFRNNQGGSFGVTGLPIGGAGGQVYYLNLSQSQSPYQEFSPISTTQPEQSTGVTIANGATGTIASFQTPIGYPNVSLIPAGVWSFYLHSYKDNANASFDIFCEVYTRTTGGTETLLLTTDPATVISNSPIPKMEITDGYYSGSSINPSDRIVVKVRATNTSNQSHIITLFSEGSQHYSYGVTPFTNNVQFTCDDLSGCSIINDIQISLNNKVNKSGDTMTGPLIVPTISAATYQNLPIDPNTFITAFTYNNNTFTLRDNSGQTFSTLINSVTGFTVNGNLNITGNTTAAGLTATTISASTYQNLPIDPNTFITGFTYNNNTFTLRDNSGQTFSAIINSVTGFTVNGNLTVTGNTSLQGLTATTISASTYQNLPVTYYYQNTTPTGTGTSSIKEGAIWVNSDTGVEYIYNNDGNSYQWVQQTLPVGPQGPQGVSGTNNVDSNTTTTFSGVVIGNGVVLSAASITNIIGYTPENAANKETVALDSSNTKYPTNNVVNTALQSFSDDVDYATMINQRILFNY